VSGQEAIAPRTRDSWAVSEECGSAPLKMLEKKCEQLWGVLCPKAFAWLEGQKTQSWEPLKGSRPRKVKKKTLWSSI